MHKLKQENQSLQRQVEIQAGRIEALQKEHSPSDNAVDDKAESTTTVETELAEARRTICENSIQVQTLATAVEQLKNENSNIRAEGQDYFNRWKATMDASTQECQDLKDKVNFLEESNRKATLLSNSTISVEKHQEILASHVHQDQYNSAINHANAVYTEKVAEKDRELEESRQACRKEAEFYLTEKESKIEKLTNENRLTNEELLNANQSSKIKLNEKDSKIEQLISELWQETNKVREMSTQISDIQQHRLQINREVGLSDEASLYDLGQLAYMGRTQALGESEISKLHSSIRIKDEELSRQKDEIQALQLRLKPRQEAKDNAIFNIPRPASGRKSATVMYKKNCQELEALKANRDAEIEETVRKAKEREAFRVECLHKDKIMEKNSKIKELQQQVQIYKSKVTGHREVADAAQKNMGELKGKTEEILLDMARLTESVKQGKLPERVDKREAISERGTVKRGRRERDEDGD